MAHASPMRPKLKPVEPAGRTLRVAVVADPRIEVPPLHYGGIERMVDMLVRGLAARGHHVTLFAHPGSKPACELVPYPFPRAEGLSETLRMAAWVARQVRRRGYDVVHNFGRLAALSLLLPTSQAKIVSYQRAITPRNVRLARVLARSSSLHFTGCSRRQLGGFWGQPNWHVVYNGVPAETYTFRPVVQPDAPLVFLGRVEHIKGPDLAIQAARAAGRRLVIAGNVPPGHQNYFEQLIAPELGERITYTGPVSDAEKNQILGGAAALLMPVRIEEPFGIVMAEALAAGTPVVGLNRGAVPEVIQHGVNGFVCRNVEEMVQAISRLPEIDRRRCRQIMEEKFSDTAIVSDYEQVYWRVLEG